MSVSVIQYGLGDIGQEIVKLLLSKKGFRLLGAIDVDPGKVGRELGQLLKSEEKIGFQVTDDQELPLSLNPDLVLHSTGSHLEDIYPQLESCLRAGADVISTAEELSYPFLRGPEKARSLDELAKANDASILGTGINPGFIMDYLPLSLSGPTQKINSIFVRRIQDASLRRRPLQRKIGVGLDKEDFQKEVAEQGGHVGLAESAALIGSGLGLEFSEISEEIEPVVAEKGRVTDFFQVEPGQVSGIKQKAIARLDGEEFLTLDLRMYLDPPRQQDYVKIRGVPEMEVEISGGTHGDLATPAVVVNSIPQILKAAPGLQTVLSLPPPAYYEDVAGRGKELTELIP